jgi:hypothetical protein
MRHLKIIYRTKEIREEFLVQEQSGSTRNSPCSRSFKNKTFVLEKPHPISSNSSTRLFILFSTSLNTLKPTLAHHQ